MNILRRYIQVQVGIDSDKKFSISKMSHHTTRNTYQCCHIKQMN